MATNIPAIITSQQAYVSGWVGQADSFIQQVARLANTDFSVDIPDSLGFGVTSATGSALSEILGDKPERPVFGDVTIDAPPTAPVIPDSPVPEVTIPEFAGSAPALQIGPRPTAFAGALPTPPTVTDPAIPSAPTISLPTAPALTAISLPAPPSIELPYFTASLPIDDLVAPTATFAFAEERYQSTLLDSAKAKLLADLASGGYGIEPADEQALFERTRARELSNMQGEADEVLTGFAARGFPLEPGEAAVALARVQQRTHDKIADANRTITLERSRLYVENRQFTLREARELETVLLQYHTAFMERTLNAAKATLDAAIAIYNTTVARYNARLQAYQAEAQVFEARIRAATAQVEIYKTRVEAANLELDVQKTGVEIYRAQLAGVQSLVDIYRARMEAAGVEANVQRTRIEAFKASVDAYAAGVQAKVSEFQSFEASIRGEVARVDAFKGEVDVYRARADAAKSKADVQVSTANIATERARITLAAYQGQIEAYKANADARLRRIGGLADIYRADAAAYGSVADAVKASYQLRIQESDNNIRWNIGVQEAKTKIAMAKIEKLRAEAQVRLLASEFGSTFYQSIVSASLGSINTLAASIENV